MADEINDVITTVERLQLQGRNLAKSRGPLKGVGDGNEFPNNPLSLYPAPALEAGDTWWKFNHRTRGITYLYDATSTRWLSSEAFHVRLDGSLVSPQPTLQSLDAELVPSGSNHDVAVKSIYVVMFAPFGTHDGTNHIELVVNDYNVATDVTTAISTVTSDTFTAGTATRYNLVSLHHEATQGSAIELEARIVGTGVGSLGVQALVTYNTIG